MDGGRRRRQVSRTLLPPVVAPIGRSRVMRELREHVRQVAPHEAPVLIVGESGTGREAFARYIHSLSARSNEPFVTLIAGALTDANAETILYGSEVGAEIKPGLLEQAERGVLYVNGLEDLPPVAQRLLSAALETGRFQRAGGHEPVRLDARIVATALP